MWNVIVVFVRMIFFVQHKTATLLNQNDNNNNNLNLYSKILNIFTYYLLSIGNSVLYGNLYLNMNRCKYILQAQFHFLYR